MSVSGPVAYLYVTILQVAEIGLCELRTLGDDFGSGIVFNTLRHLVLGEFEQFVDKDILYVIVLCCIFLVNLCQFDLVLLLCLTGLYGSCEEFLVNNHACE